MTLFLAAGNCTLDDVITAEGRIEPRQIGGNGVYAAVAMRLWQEDVRLLSVVGEDFPEESLQRLEQNGIDVSAVKTIPEPHRLRSRVFYFPDGRRTDLVEEARPLITAEAEATLDLHTDYPSTGSPLHRAIWPLYSPQPSQLPTDMNDVAALHLAPGALPNNRALARAAKERSQQRTIITIDWPWWDWDQESIADKLLLANTDYLLPSIEEARVYGNAMGTNPFEALRTLLKYGPRASAVKMGAQGSRVLSDIDAPWIVIPIYDTTVIDPTGAGDAFCAGFLVGIVRTGDPAVAALYGAVSASFIIEGFGPLHALGTPLHKVEERLQTMHDQFTKSHRKKS